MTRKSPFSVRASIIASVLLLSVFNPANSAISNQNQPVSLSPVMTSPMMSPMHSPFMQISALLDQAAQILAEVNLETASANPNEDSGSVAEALMSQAKTSFTLTPADFSRFKGVKKPTDADVLDDPWQISSTHGLILNDDGMVVPHMDDFEHDSHTSAVKRLGMAAASASSASLQNFIRFLSPVSNAITTSPFGSRHGRPHQGIDMAAPTGSSIVAAEKGKIVYSGWKTGYGNFIAIDHGHGVQTHYAHCSRLIGKLGRQVKKGELIGKVGTTGHSTGPHLHFEVLANGVHCNPVKYINRKVALAQK